MSLCESIDTLAMTYLDDELASEERRELELHLGECQMCRIHVDAERADLAMMRKALAPPPASDMLKARVVRALDAEDKHVAKTNKTPWQKYILPGSAVMAAAAALVVFLGVGIGKTPQANRVSAVAQEAVRQQTRELPLEVQGASTGPWLRDHFAPVEPPRFRNDSNGTAIELIGARATAVNGHDAAALQYLVNVGVNRVALSAVLVAGVAEGELQGGQEVPMGNLTLHVYDANGYPAVTYVDENHIGYVFTSERMSQRELLAIVGMSDLITRASQLR
ncbi:MAG TPA: zf-HC2 domain-containing protein [Kofleriaceae bacterium]|jgi:anti-sigma factor RsiW